MLVNSLSINSALMAMSFSSSLVGLFMHLMTCRLYRVMVFSPELPVGQGCVSISPGKSLFVVCSRGSMPGVAAL